MDTGKFVGLLVFGLIGIIVLSAFVPIISETTTATNTFDNSADGYYTMALNADDDTTYTIEYSLDTPGILTINGETFDAFATYGQAITSVAMADDWVLRFDSQNSQYGYLQYYDGTLWRGSNSTKSFEMTASNGTATINTVESNDATTTLTKTYTSMFVIYPDSDYTMKKPTQNAYVLGDSLIFAEGITSGTASGNVPTGAQVIKITGNITDGVTITTSDTDWIISNIEIHKTDVAGYIDLYQIEKITFDLTKDDAVYHATYSFFVVPSEITAEKSIHPDTALATVIDMLPLIAGVGLLMFLVAEFLYTRYL